MRARLPAFLGALRGLVETRLDGELVRCRIQLLKAICGDPDDRDPVVETYDDKTGAVVARNPLDPA